jgi:seryl-tRNA synthetase
VPDDEREAFIIDNDAAGMSTRELERAIRERDEALTAKGEAEKSADRFANAVKKAEKDAKKALAEAERMRNEITKLEKELTGLQKADAKTVGDAAHSVPQIAAGDIEKAKREAAEKIERLEKKLKAASSETVSIFKAHFENAQTAVNRMLGCVLTLKDEPETRDKLAAALRALCEKTAEQLDEQP